MEPITIQSSVSFNAYYKYILNRVFRPRMLWVLLGYLVLLNALTFWDYPFNWKDEWYILIMILFFIALFPIVYWFMAKWIVKKNPMFKTGATYYIDENSISYKTEDGSGTSNWKPILKVQETKTHFVLTTSSRSAHFLSKDGFSSSADIGRFKEMVKANNVKAQLK